MALQASPSARARQTGVDYWRVVHFQLLEETWKARYALAWKAWEEVVQEAGWPSEDPWLADQVREAQKEVQRCWHEQQIAHHQARMARLALELEEVSRALEAERWALRRVDI